MHFIDLNNEKLIKNIGKYFSQSWSFKALKSKYSQYSDYELIAALYTYSFPFEEMKDFLPLEHIPYDDFMVISDTHVGSRKENIDYINMAYDYANEHEIKTVLHCGDIIQSTSRGCKNELVDQEKQIDYFMNVYPESDVKTIFLLGNHDYHTIIEKNVDVAKIIESRPTFNTVGFRKAYLLWRSNLIQMNHHIDKYKIPMAEVPSLYSFVGHRHCLQVGSNSIHVPTLSDDLKEYPGCISKPGFLTVHRDGIHTVVSSKAIECDKIVDEGIVLRRDLDKKYRIY